MADQQAHTSNPDDDAFSPLAGKSPLKVIITVVVAIAAPGGVAVLAALVIAPLIARRYLRRANKHATQGNRKRSVANANRAVWLSRNSAATVAQRAENHLQLGDLEAALDDVQRALRKDSQRALPYYVRASVYDQRGEPTAALNDYQQFVALRGQREDQRTEHALQRIADLGGDVNPHLPRKSRRK